MASFYPEQYLRGGKYVKFVYWYLTKKLVVNYIEEIRRVRWEYK